MQLNKLLVLVLLFLTRVLHAQTDFRPGFVITAKGDTLYGQIDYRGDLLMASLCKFKNTDNTVAELSPIDLIGYRFIDSKFYVSKEVKGKRHFLEYLIKGKMSIYYMRDNIGDHYYIEKEGEQLIELPYEKGIKVVEEKQVFYETKKHIGILNYYMQDAPSLKSRIASIHEQEHKNLIKLAKDYHHLVCKQEECIIYRKKGPSVKLWIEANAGVTKFYDTHFNGFGGLLYLSIPRANEKVFFKTGLTYDFTTTGYNIKMYKIPLQLQYIYTAHRIQPKVSGGINLLYINLPNDKFVRNYLLSLNVGLDYKMTNDMALTFAFNTDNVPFGYIIIEGAKFHVYYSVNVGLRFDLK